MKFYIFRVILSFAAFVDIPMAEAIFLPLEASLASKPFSSTFTAVEVLCK